MNFSQFQIGKTSSDATRIDSICNCFLGLPLWYYRLYHCGSSFGILCSASIHLCKWFLSWNLHFGEQIQHRSILIRLLVRWLYHLMYVHIKFLSKYWNKWTDSVFWHFQVLSCIRPSLRIQCTRLWMKNANEVVRFYRIASKAKASNYHQNFD